MYRYVISESRSIRSMEINQYDITMATHYDITMGNDITRDIHCDITMSNGFDMCTYHGITMHYDIAMNLFYYVFTTLCLIMIKLSVVCNINKNMFMFDQSGSENTLFLCQAISLILQMSEISLHKHNSCLPPQTHQPLTCSCYKILLFGTLIHAIKILLGITHQLP